ncbi:MAG: thioredoxin domain-containing protein [Actinomycetota bacterium]|nr:thioredoxin domain-containing protein [Actinomycetota bacterium]
MPNRLADSASPYLLQHKDNPVDWFEWGDAAFDEARRRDVPVLLSVGYAACHWCHVMAHESFEDSETAAQMNRLFVNIKVDREERPDVDSVYMEAVQAMTGQGGWPMTVWLDHDQRPFYAGTYFPREPRQGMPGFGEVMAAISSAWHVRRADIHEQGERLVAAISRTVPNSAVPDSDGIRSAYEKITESFDSINGGFGIAPKFPQQPVLEFLLRVRGEGWAKQASDILEHTLDRMARGGIHDQIGGGFARYSVDSRWLVPHFEKMLYDNAQLARLYLWTGVELDRPDFVDVARSTLDYMIRDLRHPDGGFFSSEDADSEGVEGKFYVWSIEEIRALLGSEAESVIEYFGVTEAGNFEESNILTIAGETSPVGLESDMQALLQARSRRIRPGLDDKVIAAWNGLAIRALAEAGAALEDDRYLSAAREAAAFVLDNLEFRGGLARSWREGRISIAGFLDDHAAMAVGLFSLYSATGEVVWYEAATAMVGQLDRYTNREGGFFATADGEEALVKRPTDISDSPLPSGNALAAEALLISSLLTGDGAKRSRAEEALGSAGLHMEQYPSMVGHHLAVSHSLSETRELAVVGPEWRRLADVYWSRFRPSVALAVSADDHIAIPLLHDRFREGQTLAYVCEGFVCELPTSDAVVLADLLS